MSLWILDTDHVTLALANNRSIIQNSVVRGSDSVVITIITVQELYNGWTGKLNKSKDPNDWTRLYGKLMKTVEFVQSTRVLSFDEPAKQQYLKLISIDRSLARKRIEKDIRIASIALAHNATVVARNKKDFKLVPDLKIENWANVKVK